MDQFAVQLETSLRAAIDAWSGSLVHIGSESIPYRTGVVVRDGLVASIARVARDGEEVSLVAGGERFIGRVEAWDRSNGLVLLRTDPDALGSASPGDGAPENVPPVGTPVLRLAYASEQGLEAGFSVVRFSGKATEWGDRAVSGHFQLDGQAYPGFLGAAVVDLRGVLRGVVVSNADGNEGWVLPAADWRAAVAELEKSGSKIPAWLGVSMVPASLTERQAGLAGKTAAALVQGVARESPAEASGIAPGDLLLAIGGRDLADGRAIAGLQPGKKVPIEILRGESRLTLDVTPAVRL